MCHRALRFRKSAQKVRRQLYSKKERESGPDWEPATPRTLRGLRRKLIGMLTGAAPHCGPRPGATSPAIRWSVSTVKLSGRGGVGNMSSRPDFWQKNVKMDVKMSFFDVVSEVQKDLQEVSAGIGQIKNNLTYKNFVLNLTLKLARSILTSPGWIRVKLCNSSQRVLDNLYSRDIVNTRLRSIHLYAFKCWLARGGAHKEDGNGHGPEVPTSVVAPIQAHNKHPARGRGMQHIH